MFSWGLGEWTRGIKGYHGTGRVVHIVFCKFAHGGLNIHSL